MSKFPKFGHYAVVGDHVSVDVDGFTLKASIHQDPTCHIDDDDSHSLDQSVTGRTDEEHEDAMKAREAWFENEWMYVGILIGVWKAGVCLNHSAASIWGVECNYPREPNNNDHLTVLADDLIDEALKAGRDKLEELAK